MKLRKMQGKVLCGRSGPNGENYERVEREL